MPRRRPIQLRTNGDIKHYCRECRRVFKPNIPERGTAHLRCFLHVRDTHKGVIATILCGPYCRQKEQADEAHAKRRIHGYGAKKLPTPIMSYDKLFPEAEDDHS